MGFSDKIPTGIATGVSGTLMGSPVVTAIAAQTRYIPTAGDYFFYAVGANVQVQIFDGAAWQNVTAVGVGGFESFDGANVGFFNGAAGASQNVTTQKAG